MHFQVWTWKYFLAEVIILNESTNLRLTSSLANERVWSVLAQASDGVCAGTGQATSWGISSCLRTGEWPQRWVARVVGSVSFSVWQVAAEAGNRQIYQCISVFELSWKHTVGLWICCCCRCLKTYPSFSLLLHCFGFSWLKRLHLWYRSTNRY